MVFEKAHAQSVPWFTFTYHMEEVTVTLWHTYGSDSLLQIEPSGRKGSVAYGLGADIHCLEAGIWTLVPKATSGPKSRGASFCTKLWHHVQRCCSHFLLFMQIICSGCSSRFCAGASILKLIYSTLPKYWKMAISPSFPKRVVYCCYCAFFVVLMKWFSSSLISSHKTKISVVLRMFMEDQPQNRQFLTISLTIA